MASAGHCLPLLTREEEDEVDDDLPQDELGAPVHLGGGGGGGVVVQLSLERDRGVGLGRRPCSGRLSSLLERTGWAATALRGFPGVRDNKTTTPSRQCGSKLQAQPRLAADCRLLEAADAAACWLLADRSALAAESPTTRRAF